MNEPFNVNVVTPPKGFKYSKKSRIRKKQMKKYTTMTYKGCSIIAMDYGHGKDFTTQTTIKYVGGEIIGISSERN